VPAPLEYADVHVPLSVWTDPAMIARGKENLHRPLRGLPRRPGRQARGQPASRFLKPPDFRDKTASRRNARQLTGSGA